MKHTKKLLLLPFIISSVLNYANADINSDAETIFNWSEKAFPSLFPAKDGTKTLGDEWLYRYYPNTNIYTGVNLKDNFVYVLGGTFGNTPFKFKTVADTLALTKPAESSMACDSIKAPAGISYSQNGNTVKISTNGACIAIPRTAICSPNAPTQTGISVMSENNVKSFKFNGLIFASPQVEQLFGPTITQSASAKTCQRNVPRSYADLSIESDVCFDVTDSLGSQLGGSATSGLLTVKPPVTMQLQSTLVNKVVNDCFDTSPTGPMMITDAFTDEVWIKNTTTNAFDKIK